MTDVFVISTHTPHARRDLCEHFNAKLMNISTHTPHARRDVTKTVIHFMTKKISTHTPHARRDDRTVYVGFDLSISTHTPHARRDLAKAGTVRTSILFQLTRLMRGVTRTFKEAIYPIVISTHTPHARRDLSIGLMLK